METSEYGHIGQFSPIIPCFAKENTTFKIPTDSCYAKCKDELSEAIKPATLFSASSKYFSL